MNKINHGDHISLFKDEEGRFCVAADDYELFDYLEDYLIEDCDLELEYLYVSDQPLPNHHCIAIESGISFELLKEYIFKLNLDEINKIYLINNPG